MKKLLTLCISLLAAINLEAQSIIGSWVTIQEQNGQNIAILFGFEADNSAIMKTIYEINDEDLGVLNLELTVEGTYTLSGKKLTLKLDKNTLETSLGDVEWSDNAKQVIKKDPKQENFLRKTIEDHFAAEKSSYAEDLEENEEMTVISLTKTELVLKSEDDTMTFKKFN